MKATTQSRVCLVATILFASGFLHLASAQDPVSEQQAASPCERPNRTTGEECEERDLPPSNDRVMAEDRDGARTPNKAESHEVWTREEVRFLENVAVRLSRAAQAEDLDLKAITLAADQIKQRGVQLRSRLLLRWFEPSASMIELGLPNDRPQVRLSIYALAALITEVARSPLLNDRVLVRDVTGSAKARSDLDAMVELSGRIARQCEFLDIKGAKP